MLAFTGKRRGGVSTEVVLGQFFISKQAPSMIFQYCFDCAGVQALDSSLPDLSFMLAKHLV